jgi:hypothetical protein
MAKKKKASKAMKHGARSARARALKAKHPELSYAQVGERVGLSKQGVINAVKQLSRIGGKGLARKSVLTPGKLPPVGERTGSEKAA